MSFINDFDEKFTLFFPIGTRIKVNLISFETLLYLDVKVAPFYS